MKREGRDGHSSKLQNRERETLGLAAVKRENYLGNHPGSQAKLQLLKGGKKGNPEGRARQLYGNIKMRKDSL